MTNKYHDAITGKFVSKEYAEKNPDTTVKIEHTDLRGELIRFTEYVVDNILPLDYDTVDEYLASKE